MAIKANSPRNQVIYNLEASEFTFHQTGSQLFGGMNELSDYDFYAEDSSEIQAWLLAQGFELHFLAYNDDPQIVSVYRHVEGIDVQLVEDIAKKTLVQDILKEYHVLDFPTMDYHLVATNLSQEQLKIATLAEWHYKRQQKSQAKTIWQAMYAIADAIEKRMEEHFNTLMAQYISKQHDIPKELQELTNSIANFAGKE